MHSKSPVVNLAERHETLLVYKWVAARNSQLLLIFKEGNGWDVRHFGQKSLFHLIELIWSTYYNLWFSEVSDLYHCSAVIYQDIISVPFKYLIMGVFHSIFLNFHSLNILTNSKCKVVYNFQAIKLKCFLHVPQSIVNKTCNSIFLYFSYFLKSHTVEIRNLVN